MRTGCRVAGLVACCALLLAVPACGGGDVEIAPVDVSMLPTPEQVTELASQGNLNQLKAMVDANPELVQARGIHMATPLHLAAAGGHDKVVDYLLEKGADPRAVDENGFTPADAARTMGYLSLDKRLREAAGSAVP